MGMWESEPVYSVTCDEPGCCECGPEESDKRRAKRIALDPDEGWGEVDGKMYCPKHLAKHKPTGLPARRAGGFSTRKANHDPPLPYRPTGVYCEGSVRTDDLNRAISGALKEIYAKARVKRKAAIEHAQ